MFNSQPRSLSVIATVRCFFAAVVFLFFAYVPSGASAFYCDRKIVSVGDLKYEVSAKCGEPDWRNYRHEEIVEFSDDPIQRSRFVDIEQWTYNFGPQRLLRILTFRDNRLERIDTAGYGFSLKGNLAAACSDGSRFLVGDTQYETFRKCGEPASRQRHEEEIRKQSRDGIEHRIIVSLDEWIYDFGPHRLLHVLHFRDGILVKVETRGYGY